MDLEFRKILKGKWEYNIKNDKLICKNSQGLFYIFENKDNDTFQGILSLLNKRGVPNPDLDIAFSIPTAHISLDDFHRIMYSCEIVYEQAVGLEESYDGLFCFSKHINNYQLNHHKYKINSTVYVDPHQICTITRRVRDRKRVITKITLNPKHIVLNCEFPWVIVTIIIPTVKKNF